MPACPIASVHPSTVNIMSLGTQHTLSASPSASFAATWWMPHCPASSRSAHLSACASRRPSTVCVCPSVSLTIATLSCCSIYLPHPLQLYGWRPAVLRCCVLRTPPTQHLGGPGRQRAYPPVSVCSSISSDMPPTICLSCPLELPHPLLYPAAVCPSISSDVPHHFHAAHLHLPHPLHDPCSYLVGAPLSCGIALYTSLRLGISAALDGSVHALRLYPGSTHPQPSPLQGHVQHPGGDPSKAVQQEGLTASSADRRTALCLPPACATPQLVPAWVSRNHRAPIFSLPLVDDATRRVVSCHVDGVLVAADAADGGEVSGAVCLVGFIF